MLKELAEHADIAAFLRDKSELVQVQRHSHVEREDRKLHKCGEPETVSVVKRQSGLVSLKANRASH